MTRTQLILIPVLLVVETTDDVEVITVVDADAEEVTETRLRAVGDVRKCAAVRETRRAS